MFRLYAMTFKGSFRGTHEQEHHLHESPAAMTIPLVILAVLSVIGGYVGIPEFIMHGAHSLREFLAPVFAGSNALLKPHEVSHETEWMLTGLSTGLILAVVIVAWRRFSSKPDLAESSGFGKVLENKWYVDELYDQIIGKPLVMLGAFFTEVVEKSFIDGLVNGVGRLVSYGSRQMRLLQSGQVGSYVLLMVVGMVIFFIFQFFLRK